MKFLSRIFIFILLLYPSIPKAEITMDGSLGPAVSLPGPDYVIDAGLGRQVGPNLFHSFGKFNILTGEKASFTGPDTIANIISRVTGGEASLIDGLLRSEISGADFYFINPAGIMFGPNASINIGGSLYMGTADYIRLSDGGRFDAANLPASSLTSAPPAAFGFLGDNPGPITVESKTELKDEKTIFFTGGNIKITAKNLNIKSASSLDASSYGPGSGGLITIKADDKIHIEGSDDTKNSAILTESGKTGDGGRLDLSASKLVVENNGKISGDVFSKGNGGQIKIHADCASFLNGGAITAGTTGPGSGAGIFIDIDDTLEISGMSQTRFSGFFANSVGASGDTGKIDIKAGSLKMDFGGTIQSGTAKNGRSSDIFIKTENLSMLNGAFISTNCFGDGNGGNINLDAKASVKISGISQNHVSGLHANTHNGGGDGGDIFIKTPLLDMADSGSIQSSTLWNGNTGNITLELGNLFLKNGANISTDTYGDGAGGDIRIFAKKSVNITGFDEILYASSGIFANTKGGLGKGGNIFIGASNLVMDEMGQIQAQTGSYGDAGNINIDIGTISLDNSSSIIVDTYAWGKSGNININAAGKASISNLSIISASSQPSGGDSGNIKISAKDIYVDSQGIIKAETYGKGNGGNIEIKTERLQITNSGQVRSSTYSRGNSGDIFVNADDRIIISGFNGKSPSALFSNAVGGSGMSGNIHVATSDLFMDYGAMIQAATTGDGNAGTIDLALDNLFMDNYSQISAGTYGAKGDGGDIKIASSGLVSLTNGSSLSVNTWNQGKGGNIFVSARDIEVNLESKIEASTKGDGDGGEVSLKTGNLAIKGGARVATDTLAGGHGGNIFMNISDNMRITGDEIYKFTGISSSSGENGGKGGNMDISASSVLVENLGIIAGVTLGQSQAGQINIHAGNISFINGGKIMTDSVGTGQGGDLYVYAKDFIKIGGRAKANFTGISTTTYETGGQGGSINLDAPAIELYDGGSIFAATVGPGNAGKIGLNAKTLSLADGAMISTDSFGTGKGGDITAVFLDGLKISGRKTGYMTGISSNTHTGGGTGGNVIISGGDIIIEDFGYISAMTRGDGDAGFIALDGGTMNFSASLVSTSSQQRGKGGNLSFEADKIFLDNKASVTAESFGTGDAGLINMDVSDLINIRYGRITTEAKNGGGGRMSLKSGNLLYLADSEITTSVRSGAGNGGDITIDPTFVILDHSRIIANAFEGNGGNISIISDYFITDRHSRVEASSQLGIDGEINISAPDIEISGSIAVLSENFLDATGLLKDRCDVGNYETSSSLIVPSFGGTQAEPDDVIFIMPY